MGSYNCDVLFQKLSDKPLNKILGASLDSEILSDILSVLNDNFVKTNQPVDQILLELAKNDQTSILSMFLSSEDRENLKNLINYMQTSGVAAETLNSLMKDYNII